MGEVSTGRAAECVGSIMGALVALLFSLLSGDELVVVILITFIGSVVGSAVGYATYMVARS